MTGKTRIKYKVQEISNILIFFSFNINKKLSQNPKIHLSKLLRNHTSNIKKQTNKFNNQQIINNLNLNMSSNSKNKLVPVVFSGPSGVGKSTLLKKLFKEYPTAFGFSVSHTTRPPRSGEQNGVDYHFVSREEMKAEIDKDNFIEWAEFANKMYGTSKKSINDVIEGNKICILDIDEQGVKNIKNCDNLPAKFIFISPPSVEELEKRLNSRGTETAETLKARMDTAKSAIDYSKEEGAYDQVIVNDDLEEAYDSLKKFLEDSFPGFLGGKNPAAGDS